jgi:transcriptional regulator with XRE-family HTH domain
MIFVVLCLQGGDSMNTRIAFVRKNSGLNQQDFAEKIGLTKNYVSLMETGSRNPSDRTISDICREFGVDRIWLETGAGEPFRPVDRNEQIAAILGRAIVSNDTARDRLIRAFCQLPDELFPYAERIVCEIVENLKKENPG